jgi:hypothetical protein
VFLVAASLFVATLVLSALNYDFIGGLLGEKGFRVVNAVVVGALAVCSGVLAAYEFWLNPTEDTERGEWTGRQLLYAIVLPSPSSWPYGSSLARCSTHRNFHSNHSAKMLDKLGCRKILSTRGYA